MYQGNMNLIWQDIWRIIRIFGPITRLFGGLWELGQIPPMNPKKSEFGPEEPAKSQ
jgi:hypothetical protein